MNPFAKLPKPDIIEDLSYETMLDDIITRQRAGFLADGVDYDVGNLEFDPVKIQSENVAFRELWIRARGNDLAIRNLIAFSTGTTLDHLAAFHDVTRLTGESDDRLRIRVALAISGRSPGGSVDWYKAAAMRAHVDVREVAVYRTGIGPELEVAILSGTNGGETSPATLAAVDSLLQSDAVRVVSDVISVVSAVSVTVNISAQVWLLPTASQTLLADLETVLRNAWDVEGGLGFDLKRSWIAAKLHQSGVAKVEVLTPAADAVVGNNDAVSLGSVVLTYMGRDR